MARQQFDRVTAIRSAPGLSIRYTSYTDDTDVAAGAAVGYDVYAPTGNVERVLNLWAQAPAVPGAAAGVTHLMYIGVRYGENAFLLGRIDGTAVLEFVNGAWQAATGATLLARPSTEAGAIALMQGIAFDSTTPLRTYYTNNTAVPATGQRFIRLWTERQAIS